jgi:hypothetical protein
MIPLQTSDSQLHRLAEIDDSARDGTEFVKVPRQALRHLLRDHTTLWTALRERKLLQIVAGPDQESFK